MSEGFGLGDGANDLSGVRSLAESEVADAQRRRPGRVETGRWPTTGRILLILGLLALAVVALGWILTAFNG